MVKVAMLSKWHVHAEDYAKAVRNYGAEISCVWDDEPARGKPWAEALGVDYEQNLDKLLARADVDAVICDAPTTMHREVIIKAANAGKHIFTEKAMAPTVAECDEIAEAVNRNNVKFLISTPGNNSPFVRYAKQTIDSGVIGEVSYIRLRAAHDGASRGWLPDYWFDENQTGGGAMMDLGCHPMYEASYLLGEPARIMSMYNTLTGKAVEDNAVSVIEFKNKAIAVLESSLVTYKGVGVFEVYGTKGSIVQRGTDLLITAECYKHVSDGFITVTALPERTKTTMEIFLDAVATGSQIPFGLKEGRALTQLLEGAYIAHKNNTVYMY